MKMTQRIAIFAMAALSTLTATAATTTLRLDTRTGPLVADSIAVTYGASWIGGDGSATVVISDNGVEVRRTTGTGEFTLSPADYGRHELAYTTYIGGVAQEEVYRATVYKGKYTVHFDANGGDGTMADCEVGVDMPFSLPQCMFTKDGHFLLGWALTPDGEAMLLDGDTNADIVAAQGETVTLYAVWHEIVSNVAAKQRYPWNGLVDISCTVSGIEGTDVEWKFAVSAVDNGTGDASPVSHIQVVRDGALSNDLTVSANGNYRLVWDARADLGQVRFNNMVVRVNLEKGHGKVQLWAGGPYWAETNIGAENPEDYGLYFWWGDTVGYRCEGNAWVASDGSSSNFSFGSGSTPTSGKDNSTLQSQGWITSAGVLAPEHDAAHVHWGGSWRMPTNDELSALNGNCDWTWTTRNGVNGYVVRGRGAYSSASIFLPAAGSGYRTFLDSAGSCGYFWSSVPYESNSVFAGTLYFGSGYHYTGSNTRGNGRSVRPVQGFAR